MSKIQSLFEKHPGSRIYIHLADQETVQRFVADAQEEGFTFADGAKLTDREISDIMAINEDMTVNFVGVVGHIAYQAANEVGGKPLVKIEYREFEDRER